MKELILVVEDEKPLSDILCYNLEKEGYDVIVAFDGEQAISMGIEQKPSLILLDIMLPKYDGFQVCRKIREVSGVPIIMLTAKDEEVDKILGLELGADDYITKPYKVRELLARVKANLRRVAIDKTSEGKENNTLKFGDLTIDLPRYEVFKAKELINLTFREFELLKFMATHPNQIMSREDLLKEVWDYDYYGDVRTVDVTIRRLREKIEDDSSKPKYIMTKRNVGYFFQPLEN